MTDPDGPRLRVTSDTTFDGKTMAEIHDIACNGILDAFNASREKGTLAEDMQAWRDEAKRSAAAQGETRGFIRGNLEGFATGYDEAREVWYRRGFLDGFTDRAYYSPQDGEDRARKTTPDWPPAPVRD